MDLPGLHEAVTRVLDAYSYAHGQILALVDEVPDCVCSPKRKLAYKNGMEARAQWLAEDVGMTLSTLPV